jgi:predicted phage tail component-like protein
MIGFTYRDIHSSNFDIGARSVDRSLITGMRKNEFSIPGRHGTVDYGANTYDKRSISLQLGLMKNTDHDALRQKARDIAKWLSGKGLLIFDDEQDKAYDAAVYDYVGIEQIELLPAGRLNVVFECQPFAESLNYQQVNTDITTNGAEVPVVVNGTSETDCIITIKNTGATNIENITIRRKAAV